MGRQEMGAVSAQDLSGEKDGILMLYLAAGSELEKKAAMEHLHFRHAGYIYGRIRDFYRTRLPGVSQDPDAVFSECMLRIWEGADSFHFKEGTDEDERRQLRAWMGKLVEHSVIDELRSRQLPQVITVVELDALEQEPTDRDLITPDLLQKLDAADVQSPLLRLMEEALGTLTEMEQAVLRLWWLEKDVANPDARLPNNVTRQIAEQLNTTTANVRKINERAKKKIRAWFDEHAKGVMRHGQ